MNQLIGEIYNKEKVGQITTHAAKIQMTSEKTKHTKETIICAFFLI